MALVNPISYTSTGTESTTSSGVGKNEMGKDSFLQLLLAQLQNQSPLNPMDSTEFTSQLAQFSQLEQLNNMNNTMTIMQLYLASLNNAQAVDFIGKEIEAKGNAVHLSGESGTTLSYELTDKAGAVTIRVYDESNQLVRTIERGSQNKGVQEWTWDGKDNQGKQLPAGDYTFEVSATNLEGEAVTVTTYLRGVVTGVTFENGITYLFLGEQKVAIGDVVKVYNHPEGEAVAEASQSKTEKAVEVMKEIGKFMKNAAPIAAMLI
jgi:flagellar basal-body rod modification protein FlgD